MSSLKLFATRTFQAVRQNQVKVAQTIRNAVVTKVTRAPHQTHIHVNVHVDVFLAPKPATIAAPPAAIPRVPTAQTSSALAEAKALPPMRQAAESSRAEKALGIAETAAEAFTSSVEAWTDDSWSSNDSSDD